MGWLDRIKGLLDNSSRRQQKVASVILQPHGHLSTEVPRADMHAMLNRYTGDVHACVSLVATQLGTFTTPHVMVKVDQGQELKNPHKECSKAVYDRITKDPMLPSGKREQMLELTNHPLLDLFRNINPYWTNSEFFEMLSTFMDMCGEAYIYLSRGDSMNAPPDEMWPLQPQWMTPRYDDPENPIRDVRFGQEIPGVTIPTKDQPYGQIKWWQYGPGADWAQLSPDEVLLIRRPSPYHQIRGHAPALAIMDVADSSILLRRYQKALLTNRGVPDVIVRMTGGVDAKKIERFQADWKNSFGQFGGGSGGVAVVPADEVEIEQLGFSPKDMENIKASRDIRELVCNTFKVPVTSLSMEASTRATAEAGIYQLAKMVIEPRLLQLQQRFNGTGGITEMFGDPNKLFLVFDDPVPADREWELKEREVNISIGYTNPNEERVKNGLPPREGGDEYRGDPSAMMAALAPGESNGAPGGPPRSDDKDEEAKKQARSAAHRQLQKVVVGEDTPGAKPEVGGLEGLLVQVFDEQESAIVQAIERAGIVAAALRRSLDKSLWDRIRGDEILRDSDLATRALPFLQTGFESGALSGSADMLDLGLTFNLPEDLAAGAMREHLIRFAERFAKSVNTTTLRKLSQTLAEGIEVGDGIEQLANRVRGVYAEATKYRAEMIARTESKRAIEAGRGASYEESGVVSKVQWLASDGACEFCKKLNGKTVDVKGGEYLGVGESMEGLDGGTMTNKYMSVQYPPLHPNCTCTTLAVIE